MKKHSQIVFLAVFLCAMLLNLKCKNESTKPPDEIIKNPREYVWTVDTLAYPGSMQTNMLDIWASSPSDVYVVGHNERGFGKMYHSDGIRWADVKLSTAQGGAIQGAIDLSGIFGFNTNDIYAVGEHLYSNPFPPPNLLSTSLVIHFDGTTWNEISPSDSNLIETVWGNNGAIWCGGFKGIIYNYSSGVWNRDSLKIMRGPQWFSAINSLSGLKSGKMYALANAQQNGSFDQTFYFLTRETGNWSVVDTFVYGSASPVDKWGINKIWVSPTNRVFSLGPDLYEWNGAAWQTIKHPDNSFLQAIYATGDNNIFVGGTYGTLIHYNGTDWYSYDQFKTMDVHFKGIWANEKEVFAIGYTTGGNKTLVFHGR
ncbi:MAG: hypothetical protein ABSD46_05800 [Bacteroidota bacterium]